MADSRTLSVTFTMHLAEPLTKEEKDAVIVSLWEHIRDTRRRHARLHKDRQRRKPRAQASHP